MSRGSGGIKGGVAKIVILDLLVYKIRLYHLGQMAYLIGIRHRPGPTVQSSKGLPWLVDVLLAVEREQVQAGTPAGTDWRPSVLQRRAVIERSFRLQIRSEVQRVRPLWLTRRDNAAVVRHAEKKLLACILVYPCLTPLGVWRREPAGAPAQLAYGWRTVYALW